ncbi:glutamyl-tRNA(Gln) amidotransferase subunit C, mitochondrial [Cylas formicarius]|uniref:glutamyl-tRNA(Gln) amidotransferase subunit C, mitochondrial n=1 Tax=Cylas formicarius TaxID=197179 RepID=UPI002958D54C|nr:glutamyl-tRNA(Gln) amidotransferase subunit C, mitochondrial [Cylas formicarius]
MNRVKFSTFYKVRQFCNIKTPVQNLEIIKQLVPKDPVKSKIQSERLPATTKIDSDTIALIERLSLVDCANKKSIETLEAAIKFADQIQQVDTEGVEPLVTVLEDWPLQLREDIVTEGNCNEEVLRNASLTEDEYFVAPPGNIPLAARDDLLFEKEKK